MQPGADASSKLLLAKASMLLKSSFNEQTINVISTLYCPREFTQDWLSWKYIHNVLHLNASVSSLARGPDGPI